MAAVAREGEVDEVDTRTVSVSRSISLHRLSSFHVMVIFWYIFYSHSEAQVATPLGPLAALRGPLNVPYRNHITYKHIIMRF